MRYLMKVGDQLDLNTSYDGGAIDNVTYLATGGFDNKVSVNSVGVVTALGLGEGMVDVLSGGVILRRIIFSILSQSEYTAQQGVRDGSKELIVEAVNVLATPSYALVNTDMLDGGKPLGPYEYYHPPENAFDGNNATHWESEKTFSSVTDADCFIGKEFAAPKQIKKLRVTWRTAPTEVEVKVANGNSPVGGITIMTIPVVYNAAEGYMTAYDIILPSYEATTGIYLHPKTSTAMPGSYWASNGGIIDRFRVTELEFYESAPVVENPPPSTQISLNAMIAASQDGHTAFGHLFSWSRAYDAFNGTFVLGEENGSSIHAAGSNTYDPITTIGQILPAVKALTSLTLTVREYSRFPQFTVQGSSDTTTGLDGAWTTVFTSGQYPFEARYPLLYKTSGVVSTQMSWDGSVPSVVTKTFTIANSTGYKAYRLKIEGHPDINLTFYELVFFGY